MVGGKKGAVGRGAGKERERGAGKEREREAKQRTITGRSIVSPMEFTRD